MPFIKIKEDQLSLPIWIAMILSIFPSAIQGQQLLADNRIGNGNRLLQNPITIYNLIRQSPLHSTTHTCVFVLTPCVLFNNFRSHMRVPSFPIIIFNGPWTIIKSMKQSFRQADESWIFLHLTVLTVRMVCPSCHENTFDQAHVLIKKKFYVKVIIRVQFE